MAAILTFFSLLMLTILAYSGKLCQSHYDGNGGVASLISREDFDELFKHRTATGCTGGFYTYEAFVEASESFPAFVRTGDAETRKRELAAFLGQTARATTGGWEGAPDGKYAWGYCFVEQQQTDGSAYCSYSRMWPCVLGREYYGRGPIQLSYNYNYGPAGAALNYDLLLQPELVAENATLSFETSIWFWMTSRYNMPSCHDAITGQWTPSADDMDAGRLPGYGVVTNILTGGGECGHGPDESATDRVEFYKKFCDYLGVSYGDNLDCDEQKPFHASYFLEVMK